jgi:hypothetical protein
MTRQPQREAGLEPLEVEPRSVYPPFIDFRRDRHRNPVYDSTDDQREVLRAALAGAELAGTGRIELGAYDRLIVDWLARWDTSTVATVVSWLRRVRVASVYDALHTSPRGGDQQ